VPFALPAPAFPPEGGIPVSILVDYDGTVSVLDIGDELLARHGPPAEVLVEQDERYDAGLIGSRDLMRWDMDVLPDDAALLRAEAASMPQDETLVMLVECAQRHGAAVEIVSDGLGFYVESNLALLGLPDLPVATNENDVVGGGTGMRFPYGHPRCYVCGTCKRERVRAHQAADRIVVFVGEGTSDRYACAHAEVVFAKGNLAAWCRAEGRAFQEWHRLDEIARWLDESVRTARLPRATAEVAAWRGRFAPPQPRPFICGPEVWGDGRVSARTQAGVSG
jgi:2-hydroxy-3-keto-5-methylthiopentenyl-1-phosphate phosphatase